MSDRLVLPLEPNETYTRDSFRIGVNHSLFPTLRSSDNLWLYGDPAVGKTHAMHVLVSELTHGVLVSDPDYELNGLEAFETVVLDGIEQWIGDNEQEKSLFGLYENLMRAQHRIVLTSRSNLETLEFRLPDLKSRFGMLNRYHMLPIPSAEQLDFLQDLVARHGTTLSTEVARFVLRHLTRSQASLVLAVARLNEESVFRNRTISVRLVKEVFGL